METCLAALVLHQFLVRTFSSRQSSSFPQQHRIRPTRKEYSLGKTEYRFEPEEEKNSAEAKNEAFTVIWISIASYDPYQLCFPVLYNVVWHA